MTQDGCAAIPAACAADRNTTDRHHDNYNGGATLTDPSSAGFNPIQCVVRTVVVFEFSMTNKPSFFLTNKPNKLSAACLAHSVGLPDGLSVALRSKRRMVAERLADLGARAELWESHHRS